MGQVRDSSNIAEYLYCGRRVAKRNYANGMYEIVTYNAVKDVTTWRNLCPGDDECSSFEYAYTPTHNKKYEKRTDNFSSPSVVEGQTYRYNNIHELTGTKYGVPGNDLDPGNDYDDYTTWEKEEQFVYDGVGNRKTSSKQDYGQSSVTSYYNYVGVYTHNSRRRFRQSVAGRPPLLLRFETGRAVRASEETMTTVQRPRILIVEDSAPTLNILKFTFERRGYEVLTAADGEAGLSLARESSLDAILLDVMLPKKSGLEICAELKADANYRHIPIILLTALAQESGQSEESWKKKWGAEALLSKPFRVREVVATVERFIGPAPELTPESPSPPAPAATLDPPAQDTHSPAETQGRREQTPRHCAPYFAGQASARNPWPQGCGSTV